MSDRKPILERYMRDGYRDEWPLQVARLEKLRDGWENDKYLHLASPRMPKTRLC
jgi:hypothetical protein